MNEQCKKEIHFLTRFFSQPQTEQWKQVPDDFPKIIFDVSPFYVETEKPILFLGLVFAYWTEHVGAYIDNDDLAETLFEGYVLLHDFMLESNRDVVFTKREEPEQLDYIWKTFGRLCREALMFESLTKFDTTGIDFDYFVKKYAIIE